MKLESNVRKSRKYSDTWTIRLHAYDLTASHRKKIKGKFKNSLEEMKMATHQNSGIQPSQCLGKFISISAYIKIG